MEEGVAFIGKGQVTVVAGQAVEEVSDCFLGIDRPRSYAISGC